MPRGKTSTAPRIGDQSARFYPQVFSSLNAGMEFMADSFPALYRRTLHELRGKFTKNELTLMIDVFNSTMLTPGMAGQHLDIQVSDGIALDRLDEKWSIDGAALNAKIADLPIFSAACLEIWANGFWYRAENRDKDLSGADIDAWIAPLLA